jgi:hypothetical protein
VTLAFDDNSRLEDHKMVLARQTRLGKRKPEIKEVRRENQTETSMKHDMRCVKKNSEVEAQKPMSLQEKYDILCDENKKNVVIIEKLEEKVALLDVKNNSKKDAQSVESQTQWEFQEYPCNECVYLASWTDELNWHLENEHGHDEDDSDELSGPFTCFICRKQNRNKGELMHHRKTQHPVRTCLPSLCKEIVISMRLYIGTIIHYNVIS